MIPCHSWNLEKAFWIFNNIKQTTYLDLCDHFEFLFSKKVYFLNLLLYIHTNTHVYIYIRLCLSLFQITVNPSGTIFLFYVRLTTKHSITTYSFKLSILIFMNDIWISNVSHEYLFSEVSSIYFKFALFLKLHLREVKLYKDLK